MEIDVLLQDLIGLFRNDACNLIREKGHVPFTEFLDLITYEGPSVSLMTVHLEGHKVNLLFADMAHLLNDHAREVMISVGRIPFIEFLDWVDKEHGLDQVFIELPEQE